MAARRNRIGRFRLVFRRSGILTKCVVLTMVVLCTTTLLILWGTIGQTQAKISDLEDQAVQLEQEVGMLEENISELGTVQSITRIAQEELGLVLPGTTVFKPE